MTSAYAFELARNAARMAARCRRAHCLPNGRELAAFWADMARKNLRDALALRKDPMHKNKITDYRNLDTDETAPADCIGTDEDGDRLYLVPDGWVPVGPHWIDAQGYAHASATPDDEVP